MIEWVVQLFPVVVGAAIVAGLVLALSLKRRISGGATHAGPLNRVVAPVPGLTTHAWDAQSIETALASQPEAVIALLDRLAATLDETNAGAGTDLGPDAMTAIHHRIERLEATLELEPLGPPLPPVGVAPPPVSAPPPGPDPHTDS